MITEAQFKVAMMTQKQSLPLGAKVKISLMRIREALEKYPGKIVASCSGGKDSTVMMDLIWHVDPTIRGVFSDTGLEYPEIREFVKTLPNMDWVKPKMSFDQVVKKHGWPVVSKAVARGIQRLQNPSEKNVNVRNLLMTGLTSDGRAAPSFKLAKKWHRLIDAPFKISDHCCEVIKKAPIKKYMCDNKIDATFVGTLADESEKRKESYLAHGCNAFDLKDPQSRPLMLWTEQDILRYIVVRKLPISKIYGDIVEEDGVLRCTGEQRTGCMFCMFGIFMEGSPNRFERMAKTHPNYHDYCINKMGAGEVLDFLGLPRGGDE